MRYGPFSDRWCTGSEGAHRVGALDVPVVLARVVPGCSTRALTGGDRTASTMTGLCSDDEHNSDLNDLGAVPITA